MLKNERIVFILFLVSDISPSEVMLAMAREAFFTSGFLPRKQAIWNRLISPWWGSGSLWRHPIYLDFGFSDFGSLWAHHGSLWRVVRILKMVLSDLARSMLVVASSPFANPLDFLVAKCLDMHFPAQWDGVRHKKHNLAFVH